jgi:uncharacterized phage protein gp47/JayE
MWEHMTYESILEDALSHVTSDVDKREGSVIYDALAPACLKIAEYYAQLDNFVDLVFGDKAVGEYLDRVVADFGLTRKPATYAARKVTTNEAVDIGSRWAVGDVVYDITVLISGGVYSAVCETAGSIGNTCSGQLSNIDNTSDAIVMLGDIITSGTDEETDDNLRARFYEQIRKPSTSGNVYDYEKWALSVAGVGGAKVYPLWNGNGTVKALIVDYNKAIDKSLEQKAADYIETVRPIGATVTVTSPTGLEIDVTANAALDGSKTLADVQTAFTNSVSEYLKSIVFRMYSISYAKIGSLLLSTSGVSDYDTLLVNGGAVNIAIPDEDIPVTGTITLSEASA